MSRSEHGRTRRLVGTAGLLAGIALVATGCASSNTMEPASNGGSSGMTMSDGMTMPNGQTMSGMTGPAGTGASNHDVADRGPSASARLTCSDEIAGDVGGITAQQPAPVGTATWQDGIYTCTYQVPGGPLVLSVKDSPDPASAHAYFTSLQSGLGSVRPIHGLAALGLPAYETTHGTVVFLKDSSTLVVDATKVATTAGQSYSSPTDLAYEVASDVIGCWSES